jgi:hypothetical protein
LQKSGTQQGFGRNWTAAFSTHGLAKLATDVETARLRLCPLPENCFTLIDNKGYIGDASCEI